MMLAKIIRGCLSTGKIKPKLIKNVQKCFQEINAFREDYEPLFKK